MTQATITPLYYCTIKTNMLFESDERELHLHRIPLSFNLAIKAAFWYSLSVLKIYSARYVYYRFSVLAVNIETQSKSLKKTQRVMEGRTGCKCSSIPCTRFEAFLLFTVHFW